MSACRGFVLLSRSVRAAAGCPVFRSRPLPSWACARTPPHRHVSNSSQAVLSGPSLNDLQSRVRELISTTDEPEVLYKKIEVLAKGHDEAVLKSYADFTVLAANELGLSVAVQTPKKKIDRLTLLKSVHIYKKHRVQYEMRTHYKCFTLPHLTGSTANVFLEYIQRNVPEGVALEITKTQLEKLPEHLKQPVWETLDHEEEKEHS